MLVIFQAGHNPASDIYVRNKLRAIEAAGLNARVVKLPEHGSIDDVLDVVHKYASMPETKAAMVQLPLPANLEPYKDRILFQIPAHKDIDGLKRYSDYYPLTPCAIMRWLDNTGVNLEGKTVTILGRSALVGKPLADMMIAEGATVTVCNSRTPSDVRRMFLRRSDIIVSAVGKPGLIKSLDVKGPGQLVIDVGISRDAQGKVHGDVSPTAALKVNTSRGGYCTPVPGGVGKWTVNELVLRLREMEGAENYDD